MMPTPHPRSRPTRRSPRHALLAVTLLVASAAVAAEDSAPDTQGILDAATAARAATPDLAREKAQAVIADCATKPDPKGCRASAHVHLSVEFQRAAAYDLALEQARAGAELAEKGMPDQRASAALILAGAAARAGALDEAERAIRSGQAAVDTMVAEADAKHVERTRRLRDMFGGPQALVHAARGEHVRAAAAQQRKVAAMRYFDPKHADLPDELLTLAIMQEDAADPSAARATYEEVIELANELGKHDARRLARVALVRLSSGSAR